MAEQYVDEPMLTKIATAMTSMNKLTPTELNIGLVYQSITHLLWTTPGKTEIIETFRRVVANIGFIQEGQPIPGWQGEPVKTTIGIMRAQEGIFRGKSVVKLFYRSLNNITAGLLFEYTVPSWWALKLLKSKLGGKRITGLQAAEIAGCSFDVVLAVDKDRQTAVWSEIKVTPKQKEKNKELLNARHGKRPCGANFPCSKCRRTRRQCRLAVL